MNTFNVTNEIYSKHAILKQNKNTWATNKNKYKPKHNERKTDNKKDFWNYGNHILL